MRKFNFAKVENLNLLLATLAEGGIHGIDLFSCVFWLILNKPKTETLRSVLC